MLSGARAMGPMLRHAMSIDRSRLSTAALLEGYAQHLRRMIVDGVNHPEHREQPLQGLKICVDAGNGSAGFMAAQVLAPLGADVSSSQFLEPDGSFPNHQPNPEDKKAMESASKAVLKGG